MVLKWSPQQVTQPVHLERVQDILGANGGEADFIASPCLLNLVPQGLLHETDNLAKTQAGLLPDGDPVSSVDKSPSSGAQAF